MNEPVFDSYFYDEQAFNLHDAAYKPLKQAQAPATPLNIPPLLTPDKVDGDDVYYTVTAQAGATQLLPGEKTKTWGFNASMLGQTVVFERGKTYHMHLVNHLPEVTTFHWHGLEIPGPIEDGGCHAPVYPGEARDVTFKIIQPAATAWLHAHPCPETAYQVWQGLATMAIIHDQEEAHLALPHTYGVDDLPLILQDRNFHADNQFDYRADYDPDGVQGDTAVINATVNPYFDVTTQRLRLRILNGSNRREYRLHFSDDLTFTQIGSDLSFLPHPVKLKKLMTTCAERQEIVVDFAGYQPGDTVTLYSDDSPLVEFRIHEFTPITEELPTTLTKIDYPAPDPSLPVKQVVMSGMDETVMIDGKKFQMDRIDYTMPMGKCQLWDITNTNDMNGGMIHPFHMHGCAFEIVSRNGQEPYPFEHGLNDTIAVNPGEHVIIKVYFQVPGVFMYHCHIIEHEDGGMMAQLKVVDPATPDREYHLLNHTTLMEAFAKERGVTMDELWLGGMDSYKKMGMHM